MLVLVVSFVVSFVVLLVGLLVVLFVGASATARQLCFHEPTKREMGAPLVKLR